MTTSIPKILLVDDDLDLLDLYEDALKSKEFIILRANSGENALEIYKKNENVQIVISDSKMAGMTGMELLLNLNPSKNMGRPLFYLATGSNDFSEDEVIKVGGKGLLLKPFDLEEISEKIKKEMKF